MYDSLKKVIGELARIGCAAHPRRKFHQALKDGDRGAVWFIGQFRQLYRIERETKSLLPEDRHQIRQEQASPIWAAIQERAETLQPQLLPKSNLGKAVSYFLNEYEALTGYLKSGTFQIDNNTYAARGITGVVVQRRPGDGQEQSQGIQVVEQVFERSAESGVWFIFFWSICSRIQRCRSSRIGRLGLWWSCRRCSAVKRSARARAS